MRKVELRGWQKAAFARYLSGLKAEERSSLWEATPGAGKTTAALEVVRHQLVTRRAQKALVVVPTAHLRVQWCRAAAKVGLQLDSGFGGTRSVLAGDFHGAIVTYQQFATSANIFRELATRSVVVLDEVHHAGDGLSWGNSLRATLKGARYILCLSGTAFRSDANAIPFVRYDGDGTSVPDYTYGYASAVEDGVCRPSAFFTYGGDVSWAENGRVLSVSFSQPVDNATASRRLRAALDGDAGWIQPMLKDAHEMLTVTRREHPQAGGLIVCADQAHARQLAKQMAELTGERPTVVLSDDSRASNLIKQFADSSAQWIVACNMVSEGVDIPRLRIGVYATTVRTKLYFRQFLGRVVRRQSTVRGRQVAYVYLPADPVLHQLAEEIETEVRHLLHKPQRDPFEDERERRSNGSEQERTWNALGAVNSGVDAVIVHGNQLSLLGESYRPESVQEVIHQEVETRLGEGLTRSESKARLASEIKNLVGLLHRRTKKPHSEIHSMLNRMQSVRSQTHCTEQQLYDRASIIRSLLENKGKGRRGPVMPGRQDSV